MASIVSVDFMSASHAPTDPSLLSWLKPRHGVGRHVTAVEATQAVDRDGAGVVLLHQVAHAEIHRGTPADLFGRWFDQCGIDESRVGIFRCQGRVSLLVSFVEQFEINRHDLCAQ